MAKEIEDVGALTDGFHLLINALKLNDINTIYNVPGIPITDLGRYMQAAGMRVLSFRHEQNAGYAAAIAGFLTKRPGVCLTVSAPGFLNGLTALAHASINCFPMILISGSSEREIVDLQQGDYEEMDQLAIAKPLCKAAYRILHAEDIGIGIARAIRAAVSGRPGGVYLDIPAKLIGQVMNVGDLKDPQTRVYETNAYLPYHCDPSDVVGLLCLRKARSGGVSSLVSVAALYNRMVEVCPHYLGLFYRPMYYAHLGEELPTLTPLFSYHAGKLSCRYLRQYIELAHDVMGTSLSKVENEAFDFFDAIAAEPELRLDMLLEPGDIQFANNYMILHSRTAFDDHEEQSRRRKMLRLWLKMPNARTLAPDFPGRNGIPARMPVA